MNNTLVALACCTLLASCSKKDETPVPNTGSGLCDQRNLQGGDRTSRKKKLQLVTGGEFNFLIFRVDK